MLKRLLFIWFLFLFVSHISAQSTTNTSAQATNCVFKDPAIRIHFGTGTIRDVNNTELYNYSRVGHYCPSDGYYSFASYTSACFSDDWHTLEEDHTAGDAGGNMLLVNGAPRPGVFFSGAVGGLKPGTIYEFGVWVMNLCKPTEKCPFPLLPNLSIRLETPEGNVVAKFVTGELVRVVSPHWTQYRAVFTSPATLTALTLVMADLSPGGCGNDFAMDDITFTECIKIPPPVVKKTTSTTKSSTPKTTTASTTSPKPPVEKKQPAAAKPVAKKSPPPPPEKETKVSKVAKPQTNVSTNQSIDVVKQGSKVFPPPPLVLKSRENALVKRIETEASQIKISLYDNGEIDDDTVSIYHNNTLIRSHARLSGKPITFNIDVDESQPHHEVIMVAENLGSIPPNTSVMIITAGSKRYEVFISSSEQKNAKVVFDLKK